MLKLFKRLVKEESGQGLTEYALIISLIAIVVIAVLGLLGDQIKSVFNKITGALTTVSTSSTST